MPRMVKHRFVIVKHGFRFPTLSTVQRILAGTTGASVDNVEAIANALGVSITTLVRPR